MEQYALQLGQCLRSRRTDRLVPWSAKSREQQRHAPKWLLEALGDQRQVGHHFRVTDYRMLIDATQSTRSGHMQSFKIWTAAFLFAVAAHLQAVSPATAQGRDQYLLEREIRQSVPPNRETQQCFSWCARRVTQCQAVGPPVIIKGRELYRGSDERRPACDRQYRECSRECRRNAR